MPPKDKQKRAEAKAKVAQKQKVVEDKTFGLKNKNKSKTVQKYVESLQKSVAQSQQQLRGQGPSKKDRKALEEQWAAELNAIFKPVVKEKTPEQQQQQQEEDEASTSAAAAQPAVTDKVQLDDLIAAEIAANRDVTEIIEAERRRVKGATKITQEVFQKWRKKKMEARKKDEDKQVKERWKKGILNGREIFMQKGFSVDDDDAATDAYDKENDDEADIKALEEEARRRLEAARAEAAKVQNGAANPAEDYNAAPASAGDAVSSAVLSKLSEKDAEDIFGDDDDDDLDDAELDQLEASLQQKLTT